MTDERKKKNKQEERILDLAVLFSVIMLAVVGMLHVSEILATICSVIRQIWQALQLLLSFPGVCIRWSVDKQKTKGATHNMVLKTLDAFKELQCINLVSGRFSSTKLLTEGRRYKYESRGYVNLFCSSCLTSALEL